MTNFLLFASLLQLQAPTERQILVAEYARPTGTRAADSAHVATLRRGATSSDPHIQLLSARAVGRLEQPALASIVEPLLHADSPDVRREAANALAQMHAALPASLLSERDPSVRAALLESMGRSWSASPANEVALAQALDDADIRARTGAARGLEAYLRRTARSTPPSTTTITAILRAFAASPTGEDASDLRQLLLLSMAAAGNRDSSTLADALRDKSAQVRRLAVAASRQWIDDVDPQVRYQALRVAGNCERASAALTDSSEHVALTAVDLLGERKCDANVIEQQVRNGATWRLRARALVSLARVAPDKAQRHLATFSTAQPWQQRSYAAAAARIIGDSTTLRKLARDANPNVAASAVSTISDARYSLRSTHSGQLLAAATFLKGNPRLKEMVPDITAALARSTRTNNVTTRDARVALLSRLNELTGDTSYLPALRPLLADADVEVAAMASRILTDRTGKPVPARTVRYTPAPMPSAAYMKALQGARAELTFRDLGKVTVELMPDDAPVTVAVFAQLADAGRFNNLTIHRIVPNFVIQGGSPGADEYDGLTNTFMRDELGFARNARGTLGISTRGRDTGDGQIYVNLIDNFRLDHDYTVFARVLSGMSLVDRVQEGQVIQSVRIIRAAANR